MANTITVSVLGDVRDINRKMGQLNKSVGGIGKSFKRVGGLIAGAFIGRKVADGLKDIYAEGRESNKVMAQTEAVLKSTGGAAGVTAQHVADLSNKLGLKAGIDTKAIQSAQNLMLTFTNVKNEVGKGNDVFDQATQTVTDMSVALGQDMKSSTIQLGKALNDPIKGISALSRVGVSFTEQQKKQIKTMVEAGDTAGAQKIILKELKKEFGGSAEAVATPWDKLQVALGSVKEALGRKLIPYLDKAATWIQERLPAAIEWAKDAFNSMKPTLQTIADIITGTIVPAISSFIGWLQQNSEWLKPIVVGILAIVAAIKVWSIVTGALAIAQAALNVIMALNPIGIIILAIIGLIAAIVYLWKTNEGFRNVVKKVWAAIKGFVLGVINWFKTDVPKAWNAVKDKTVAIWNAVKDFVVNLWNTIKNKVTSTISNFINGVKAKWDYFKQLNITAFNIIKDKIAAIWDGIKRTVTNAVTRVVDTAKGIKDKVVNFFSGAGKWLWNAGKNIIQGLIDGVSNMIQTLKNKFSSITNLIPDWKGPANKDAKLLYKAGELIMGGLIKGIDDKTGKLKSTLGDVTSLIQGTDVGSVGGGAIDLALSGSGRGLAGSVRPVEITVVALDPQSASDAVVDAIRQYERVNGSGWRS